VRDAKGRVVRRADQVAPGEMIDIRVASGRLAAQVEQVASA
jgi:exonuclease VII large subunit